MRISQNHPILKNLLEWIGAITIFVLVPFNSIHASADSPGTLKEQFLKEAQSKTSIPKSLIALSSEFVEVAVDTTGNFTMGTLAGDPDNPLDNNKRILFGHPFPGTSATTLRVDGQDFWNLTDLFSSGSKLPLPVSGPTTTAGVNTTVWRVGDIQLTQHLRLAAGDSGRLDTLLIEYTVQNMGIQSHEAGVRLFLDTQLGTNDGAPFRVPGLDYVTTEKELLGSAIPPSYLSFDNLLNPTVQTQGTLIGGLSVIPDRVAWGNWGHLNDAPFDFIVIPNLSILGDSAVAMYWNPAILSPGQTRRMATYYGLGDLEINEGELIVGLYGPTQLTIENGQLIPNPFTVTAFVSNPYYTKDVTSEEVQAELALTEGLSLEPGETAVHNLGVIAVNATVQTSWRVLATGPGGQDQVYSVQVTKAGMDPILVSRTIHIPQADVTLHPGFETGVPLGEGLVQSSIGIADIDQDGLDEIVVGGADGTLYGYNGDGTPVIQHQELKLRTGGLFTGLAGIYSTPTMADVDYDKRVDMFFGNDNGSIYHLELRLSTDPGVITGKSLSIPAALIPKAAPAEGEEDDTGR